MIETTSDLISIITCAGGILTSLLVAIRYSRCKVIRCGCLSCEREVADASDAADNVA